MACYAASLAHGNNLLCKTIKSSTITKYLNAVSKLYLAKGLVDPCQHAITKQQSYFIRNILLEQKRWELMPNRREPLTWEMVDHIHASSSQHSPLSLHKALEDWLILGMHAGFRLSEWAQACSRLRSTKDIARNKDSTPTAFTLADFSFMNENSQRLDSVPNLADETPAFVNIRWRVQKNNNNGEVLTFAKNDVHIHHCPVRACLRIVSRHTDLSKHTSSETLAVFYDSSQGLTLIDDSHIAAILRCAASKLYNIKSSTDLNRWSSHSIRVGACVALHSAGKDALFIKHRLRWRSDTFQMYLRNIPLLAIQHTQTIGT